jgi:dTDP-4-dehydrorhamnose reductase
LRILVTGSRGQLGREVLRAPAGEAVERVGLGELDIADRTAVLAAVAAASPGLVVNCAAYTAVDDAESDRDAAFRVNRDGPANLAEACARSNVPLIHLSTDYVFSGEKGAPYDEDDAVDPINVYGASKAAGEAAVRERHELHVILRTSWLYGAHGRNFVRTMLRLAESESEIRVVDDQQGSPTAAPDLAAAILRIAERATGGELLSGTYHCCNSGTTTWFGFATAIFETAIFKTGGSPAPRLVPIATAEMPRPARRPRFSVLDCRRLAAAWGIEMRPWRAALADVLGELQPVGGGTAR